VERLVTVTIRNDVNMVYTHSVC